MNDTSGRPEEGPSGRFVLRLEPGVHGALREAAAAAGSSLNEYCARKLAAPGLELEGPAPEALSRALAQLGSAVLGVLVFGSWARGEEKPESDVDLLIVLHDRVPITRDLYRPWDAAPLSWEGHPLEPHFVHLPSPESRITGLWAEVALDGIVLFDPGLALSRQLSALRRRIAEGRFVRREVQGQPYWVEAA